MHYGKAYLFIINKNNDTIVVLVGRDFTEYFVTYALAQLGGGATGTWPLTKI